MNIIIQIQYYKETSTIESTKFNGINYEQFRKLIFDKFIFITNTDNLKIFYSPAILQYESIVDSTSLQKYLSFIKENQNETHRLFIRNPKFEENILDDSSPALDNFTEELKKQYTDSKNINILQEINQRYDNILKNFSQNLTSALTGSLQEYAQTHLSSVINVQPLTPSEQSNLVSTNKSCSVCGECALYGCIYECNKCTNFILCKFCFERFRNEYLNHQKDHLFYKVKYVNTLYSPLNRSNKLLTSDYIRDEIKKLQYADSSLEVKVLSDLKVFLDFTNEEAKNELKIPMKIKSIGTRNISAMLFSPFGNNNLNVFKMPYDVPVNASKNSETEIIINMTSVFKDKSIGIYYIPFGIAKNRKYIKGSIGVIEVKIQIKAPNYQQI